MGKITVQAGDFKGDGSFSLGSFRLKSPSHWYLGESIDGERLHELSVASEESAKRFLGASAAGLLGFAVLGPFGAIVGALAGGNSKNVTFVATFSDGRRMLATTDGKTFLKMQAMLFNRRPKKLSECSPMQTQDSRPESPRATNDPNRPPTGRSKASLASVQLAARAVPIPCESL